MRLSWSVRIIAIALFALSAPTSASAAQVRIVPEAGGYRLLLDGAPS